MEKLPTKPFSLYLRPYAITNKMPITGEFAPPWRDPRGRIDLEQVAALAMREAFPMIAAGPEPPYHGADRISLDQNSWKSDVSRLILGADILFLAPATSPGTLWEIEFVLKEHLLHKTIWIMPTSENKNVNEDFSLSSLPLVSLNPNRDRYKNEWLKTQQVLSDTFHLSLPWFDDAGAIFSLSDGGQVSRYTSLNLSEAGSLQSYSYSSPSRFEGDIELPLVSRVAKTDTFRNKVTYITSKKIVLQTSSSLFFELIKYFLIAVVTGLALVYTYNFGIFAFLICCYFFLGAHLNCVISLVTLTLRKAAISEASRFKNFSSSRRRFRSLRVRSIIYKNGIMVTNFNHHISRENRSMVWLYPFVCISFSFATFLYLRSSFSFSRWLFQEGIFYYLSIITLSTPALFLCVALIEAFLRDIWIRLNRTSLIERALLTADEVCVWKHPSHGKPFVRARTHDLLSIEKVDSSYLPEMDDSNCGLIALRFKQGTFFLLRNAAVDEVEETMKQLSRLCFLKGKVVGKRNFCG